MLLEHTAFEPKNTNGIYDAVANVSGLFRSPLGGVMVPDECPAGYLCVMDGLMPLDGYDGQANGNSWYFRPAYGARVVGPLLCRFPQGWVPGAPWGCTGEIIYNYDG